MRRPIFRIHFDRIVAMSLSLVALGVAPIVQAEWAAILLWIGQLAALAISARRSSDDSRGIAAFATCWLAGHTLFGVTRWPIPMVIAFGLFAALLFALPTYRGILARIRFGRITTTTMSLLSLIAVVALVVLFVWRGPNAPPQFRHITTAWIGSALLFAITNSIGEEFAWRLFGWEAARIIVIPTSVINAMQAMSFGIAHYHGVPSGLSGVGLATAFGLALGILRQISGGLAAPTLAHFVADIGVAAIAVG